MDNYHPEPYWSEVAQKIKTREGVNVIAGDDEPYYRYKRKRFLKLLNSVDFAGKSVLEIGSGPGGNLIEVWKHKPARLAGADISAEMIDIARKRTDPKIEIVKTDGQTLPFQDDEFDIVFTATVLQHNTDEEMLKKLVKEICRVSKKQVYLFERIEKKILGTELCYGRPVKYYQNICQEGGFRLASKKFINTRVSYYMAGFTRKALNPKSRKEGEPLNKVSLFIQSTFLPLTRQLDKVFTSGKDVGRLEFVKE